MVQMGFQKICSMFRNYIACTNRRLLYIEGIRPNAFRVLTFLRTAICIPYKEIIYVSSDKRKGIHSGEIVLKLKIRK